MGVGVGDDVELAERGGAGVERALGDHEGVRVVVDVREADAVAPGAEDAEPAGARRLEQVGQEEVVARAVDLVRGQGQGLTQGRGQGYGP